MLIFICRTDRWYGKTHQLQRAGVSDFWYLGGSILGDGPRVLRGTQLTYNTSRKVNKNASGSY
jgi:hypothetical protein